MVDESRGQPKAKVPISRHPLFPATVALWFGALFGLGSLAISAGTLGGMVTAAHLDSLFPAAAPPLGITARILLALAMAGIGGMIGARLARQVAQPKAAPRPRRRATAATTPAPGALMRSDYADEEAPAPQPRETEPVAPGAPLLKRRALALSDEPAALDIHDLAPLPGGDPAPEPVADPVLSDEPEEAVVDIPVEAASEDEPPLDLEQLDLAAEAPVAVEAPRPFAPLPERAAPSPSAAERITSAPLDELAPVELVERLAIALERRRARVRADTPAPTTLAPVPATPPDLPAQPLSPESLSAESLSTGPLPAMPAALRPLVLEEPEDDDQADLAFDLPPRGFTLPEGQSDVPPPGATTAGAPADTDENDDDESRVLEEGYSSLLGLSRPMPSRTGFVRVEEPENTDEAVEPVVIFPGQAPRPSSETGPVEPQAAPSAESPEPAARPFDNPNRPAAAPSSAPPQDPDEAERALRAALMTLQRMSGAA